MPLIRTLATCGLILFIFTSGCGYNPKGSGRGLPSAGFKGTVECLYSGCHDSQAVSWALASHANGNAWPGSVDEDCTDCHDPVDDLSDSALIFTSNPAAISAEVLTALGTTARPIAGCEACHGSGMEHYAYAGTALYYGSHREPLSSTLINIWGNPYHLTSCGPCHSRNHHAGGASNENIFSNQFAEWWHNDGTGFLSDDGHSDSLVVETYQGYMTSTLRGTPCVACHTVEGFVTFFAEGQTSLASSQSEIDRIISETGDTDIDDPSSYPGSDALSQVSCVTCHPSHQPGRLIRDPFDRASLCMTCHNVRELEAEIGSGQAGTASLEIPRHPQREMFLGYGNTVVDGFRGVELPGFTYDDSSHAGTGSIPDGCAGCHYYVVSDAQYSEYPDKATAGHRFKPRLENCLSSCHSIGDFFLSGGDAASYEDTTIGSFDFSSIYYSGTAHAGMDYDGDGDVEPLTEEVDGMLGELKKRLRDRSIDYDSVRGVFDVTEMAGRSATERAAAYNYDFVVGDGSLGYHNPLYVVNLLAASISVVP